MAGTGRREANRARTRDAIMVAAIELMAEQGYQATTTTQIAKAAGVAPATLFNHYPTKASILFGDNPLWQPLPLAQPAETPRQTILLMLAQLLDRPEWTRNIDHPLARIRFALVQQEPELQRAQLLQAMVQVPGFADTLHQLHPELDELTCLHVAGAVAGAVASAITFTTTPDVRRALMTAAEVALTGCGL